MKPLTLYILRHDPSDLSQALFSPHDSSHQICTIFPPGSERSDVATSESSVFQEEGSSECGNSVSYAEMLDMVIAAKKIVIL